MASKTKLLQGIFQNALDSDINEKINTELTEQFIVFKKNLIHDLEPKDFADLYAQTLAYGMLVSSYQNKNMMNHSFNRDIAAKLMPKNNPLLQRLFQYIAGYNIDERIKIAVDNLAEIFNHANIKYILSNHEKSKKIIDPTIHFYETFLTEYDCKLRKNRGV